jgi:hypothetical protein
MIAKMTSKNQITLPKRVIGQFSGVQYFDVQTENGRIMLTPVRWQKADAVRSKLDQLGLTEADVTAAIRWARKKS